MKWLLPLAMVVLVSAAPSSRPATEYLVVTVPSLSAQMELDVNGRGRKLGGTGAPFAGLTKDGWEFVSAVPESGGRYTCIFKK